MLASGNWIVPRLYGEPLFTKPPGMYIAIALCSLPAGRVTDFTARLPSALAATGCVLLFWWYFKRQLGRGAGLAAGLIVPMSLMWLDKASSAEIDTLQVFWVTASLMFFFAPRTRPLRPAARSAGGWRRCYAWPADSLRNGPPRNFSMAQLSHSCGGAADCGSY